MTLHPHVKPLQASRQNPSKAPQMLNLASQAATVLLAILIQVQPAHVHVFCKVWAGRDLVIPLL